MFPIISWRDTGTLIELDAYEINLVVFIGTPRTVARPTLQKWPSLVVCRFTVGERNNKLATGNHTPPQIPYLTPHASLHYSSSHPLGCALVAHVASKLPAAYEDQTRRS